MSDALTILLLGVEMAATPARHVAQSGGVDVVSNLASGLIGALVGAAAASGTSLWLQRNDRVHRQRSGARVIVIELIHNQNILEGFRRAGSWQPDLINRSFWETEGVNTAQALTPEELVAVGEPYLLVQALEAIAATYRANNTPNAMLSAQRENDILTDAVTACSAAITILRTYAGFNDAEFDRLQRAASR